MWETGSLISSNLFCRNFDSRHHQRFKFLEHRWFSWFWGMEFLNVCRLLPQQFVTWLQVELVYLNEQHRSQILLSKCSSTQCTSDFEILLDLLRNWLSFDEWKSSKQSDSSLLQHYIQMHHSKSQSRYCKLNLYHLR